MDFCRICFIVYILCTYIAGTERYYHSQWIIVLKILICVYSWLLWSSGPCLATTGAERRPADCKSVTQKHRRFEVSIPLRSAQDKRPLDVCPAPCPIHFPFACPSGLWCHSAKVVCGDAPKVQILPQTLLSEDIS